MGQGKQLCGTILIIGAGGQTGRKVSQKLDSLGIPHKKVSRTSSFKFDWNDEDTWKGALYGTSALYLNYFPNPALPPAIKHIYKICNLAKELNVKHITLLSERGNEVAKLCESIVINSVESSTIVRASQFYQNFTEGFFNYCIENCTFALPVANIKEPFIDIDDIADVVVASLTDERHKNMIYEVTGPELLSFSDVANKFSEVLGKNIKFTQVSLGEFSLTLNRLGLAQEIIQMFRYLFTVTLDGRNESLSNGVELALNRLPKTFDDFIHQNLEPVPVVNKFKSKTKTVICG